MTLKSYHGFFGWLLNHVASAENRLTLIVQKCEKAAHDLI